MDDRITHDIRWSEAEQRCTDYGTDVLAPRHGATTTRGEDIWYAFSDVYRWIMRNQGPVVGALSYIDAQGFVLWITDVTTPDVVRVLTQLAWEFAHDPLTMTLLNGAEGLAKFLIYAPVLVGEWLRQIGGGEVLV